MWWMVDDEMLLLGRHRDESTESGKEPTGNPEAIQRGKKCPIEDLKVGVLLPSPVKIRLTLLENHSVLDTGLFKRTSRICTIDWTAAAGQRMSMHRVQVMS